MSIIKSNNIWVTLLVFISLLICGCDSTKRLIDAEFSLAQESRLPKWVEVSNEYTRSDITVEVLTFSSWTGMKARVIVHGPSPNKKILMDKVGTLKEHPITKERGQDKLPSYWVISIDGTEEVFVKRQRGNLLHITDNPK